MNIRLLIFAFIFTLATSGVRADVVVYKGTATCLTPAARSNYSKTPKLYYVVDLATREAYTLFFFTLNGLKKQSGSPALTPTRYTSAAGNGGRTLGNFTYFFDDGGNSSYNVTAFYFRGKESAVSLSSTKTGNFPKTMTGIFRGAGHAGIGSSIDEINFVLTYDSFHTQSANNVSKSGTTTYGDLQGELTAKGFQ